MTTHRLPGRRLPLVACLGASVALLGLAACGDDDATTTTVPPATAPAGAGGDSIEIVGVDYAYEGVPEQIAVGTRLEFRNVSEQEVHEIVLLRIADGEERPLPELLALPEEETDEITELVGVNVAFPGQEGMTVVGDLTLAEPGRYVLLCFIPQGADPEEFAAAIQEGGDGPPDVAGGDPHVVYGMVAEVQVS